jgi:hypothetical protein
VVFHEQAHGAMIIGSLNMGRAHIGSAGGAHAMTDVSDHVLRNRALWNVRAQEYAVGARISARLSSCWPSTWLGRHLAGTALDEATLNTVREIIKQKHENKNRTGTLKYQLQCEELVN